MSRLVSLMLVALGVLCCAALAPAASLSFLPHVSGHDPAWSNELAVDSFDDADAQVYLALYRQGTRIFSGSYALPARETLRLDLDAAGADTADCGYVLVHTDQAVVHEGFGSLLPGGGGVADFILPRTTSPRLGFVFPEAAAFITWKGLALTNASDIPAVVTLSAWGANQAAPLGQTTISLGAWSRVSGVHTTWFPGVDLADLVKIEAQADAGELVGLVISGDAAAGRLFFSPATPLP